MSGLNGLLACAGNWQGTNRLQDPHSNSPEETPSTATVTPVLGGRFVRLDYTWTYHGEPQEGSLLIGYERKINVVTAYWIDSWHMSDKVMECRGAAVDGEILLLGSYAAPPGPDWGWRITIATREADRFNITMHNVEPGGHESLAVESQYYCL